MKTKVYFESNRLERTHLLVVNFDEARWRDFQAWHREENIRFLLERLRIYGPSPQTFQLIVLARVEDIVKIEDWLDQHEIVCEVDAAEDQIV